MDELLVGTLVLHQDAHLGRQVLAAAVQVGVHRAREAGHVRQFQLLADLGLEYCDRVRNLAVTQRQREGRLDVGDVASLNSADDHIGKVDEFGVLGHEVGLRT